MKKIALLSLLFLGLISIGAIAAPWVTHYSYEEQILTDRLEGPSWNHWMGTDQLGRDLYSRIVYGARMSLTVGVLTAFIALGMGLFTGGLAGYFGGRIDRWISSLIDLFYIFPALLMAILLTVVCGRGILGILIALSLSTWVTTARLVRGMVLQTKEMAYIESARAVGAPHSRILIKHILPNLSGPILVALTFQIPTNIMAESFLSFLGLGVQPPYSTWGTLAAEGFRAIRSFPHLIIFPGTILFLSMLAFNLLGDGLRDWLDPHDSHNSRRS